MVTAVVAVLAVLQYRWTGTISQADQQRLKVGLDTSVRNFNQEFSYDFERLCEGFEVDAEAPASTIETRLLASIRRLGEIDRGTAVADGPLYLADQRNGRGTIGIARFGRPEVPGSDVAGAARSRYGKCCASGTSKFRR